jgi:hypothetical protein
MIIKCNDYLPSHTNYYRTDLGILKFERHWHNIGIWYKIEIVDLNGRTYKTFKRNIPYWWENEIIPEDKT